MPISVVVGGQFGSEGKGKVAHFFAKARNASVAIRVGGSNSGHTIIDEMGNPQVFRHLPTSCLIPTVLIALTPGNYIHLPTLSEEVKRAKVNADRLAIDPYAWIIQEDDLKAEKSLVGAIGSTGSGTGAALVRRIARSSVGTFAKDVRELRPYIRETTPLIAQALRKGQRMILEGTQGFGLSNLHSQSYPHCTSRDTTAAAFLSEAGLSPLDVDEIILVIRTFPIRVAGRSGTLPHEIDWGILTAESGHSSDLIEYTSVTHRVRRVARFDSEVVKRAIEHNRPSCIVLNHLDYVDAICGVQKRLTEKADNYLRWVESRIEAHVSLLGFGRSTLSWRDSQMLKRA